MSRPHVVKELVSASIRTRGGSTETKPYKNMPVVIPTDAAALARELGRDSDARTIVFKYRDGFKEVREGKKGLRVAKPDAWARYLLKQLK